jgi:hypothetical protein
VRQVLVNTIHGSRQSRENDRVVLRYRRVCVYCPSCQRVRSMAKADGKVQRDKGRGRWYEPLEPWEPWWSCRVPWPARSAGVHRCVGSEDSRREPAGSVKRLGCRTQLSGPWGASRATSDCRFALWQPVTRLRGSEVVVESGTNSKRQPELRGQQWLRNMKGAGSATGDMLYNIAGHNSGTKALEGTKGSSLASTHYLLGH